mmetsp:Transcript_14648/g.34823  ORF Transcript_14648/g.34823 Transcript_14648/m.34823 type:complete len:560 (-) Transcript_14648:757-2436(-)
MGNSCTSANTVAHSGNSTSVHEVWQKDGKLKETMVEAAREISTIVKSERVNMGKFINSEPPKDPDMRLLRLAATTVVFSATEEHLRFFVESPDAAARLNGLSIQMSPTSINFGCTGLTIIFNLSDDIRNAGVGVHNAPISNEQLARAMKLKAMWKKLLDANAVRNYEHPRLGRVPVVQPIIHSCIQWRGSICGNGTGISPDPIFRFLLDHGARVDIGNSLGLTTMHTVVEACERIGGSCSDPQSRSQNLQRTLKLAEMLAERGASVRDRAVAMTGNTARLKHAGIGLERMLAEGFPFNALEACRWWQRSYTQSRKELEALEKVLERLVAAEPGDDGCAGPSDGLPGQRPPPGHGPPVLPAEWQDTATHPLQPPLLPPSWVQAIFNTLWLMQQLSSLGTPAERRALLTQIAPRAPFQMPLMTAVPFSALRGLGRLPRRDTSVSNEERGWQGPVPAHLLPEDAIVLFLSHRWLQPGNPDDEEGTKYKQIMKLMELIAEELGGDRFTDRLYLWADYCCIDQVLALGNSLWLGATLLLPFFTLCFAGACPSLLERGPASERGL